MSEEEQNIEHEDEVVTEDVPVVEEHHSLFEHTEHSTIPTLAQLAVALSLLVGVFAVSYVPMLYTKTAGKMSPVEERIRANETNDVAKPPEITQPHIDAASAFVWDVAEQRALYNKNASAQLPLASLTKLMTALVAREVLNGTTRVPITVAAISQDGDSGLMNGETFPEKDLSSFALISSSNDAAFALAAAAGAALTGVKSPEEKFVDAMNIRAEELGLSQTYFLNPTGLDSTTEKSGSYGSARDVAFLMEYLLKKRPEIVETTKLARMQIKSPEYPETHTATNTNDILRDIPGLISSKTGYTTLAGGNLVVAFDIGLNHPIIVSVLGSSRDGRFTDVKALVDYARAKIIHDLPQ